VPIISQVWDLLETPHDPQTQGSSRYRRSSSTPADGVNDGRRRLSLKRLFQRRSSRTSSRRSRQDGPQIATTSLEEPSNDDTSLLTDAVIDGIPSTEIDLVNYIVAHGILSKELR